MEMEVRYEGNGKYVSNCRGHEVVSCLMGDSGKTEGMTPPELLIASLGSCMGIYAANYCENTGMSSEGMKLKLSWEKASDPPRIAKVNVTLELPNADVGRREKALIKVVESCLVHQTMTHSPAVEVKLAGRS